MSSHPIDAMKACGILLLFSCITALDCNCQAPATVGVTLGYLVKATAKTAIPLWEVMDTVEVKDGSGKEWRKMKKEQIDSMNRLIAKDRKNTNLYVSRAKIRASIEDFDGAQADYMYVYELKDRSREFLMAFGKFSRYHGHRANALTCFNSLIKRDSTDAEAHLYRGITRLYLPKSRLNSLKERCEESLPDFTNAVRYDSSLTPALVLRGYVNFYRGSNTAAINDLSKALAREQKESAYYLLYQTYMEADQTDKACETLKKVVKAGIPVADKYFRKSCNN